MTQRASHSKDEIEKAEQNTVALGMLQEWLQTTMSAHQIATKVVAIFGKRRMTPSPWA